MPAEKLCTAVNQTLDLRCDREDGHDPHLHWQDDPGGVRVWGTALAQALGGSYVSTRGALDGSGDI